MSEAWVNAKYDEHLNAVEEVAALRQRVSDLEAALHAIGFGTVHDVRAEARRMLAVGSVPDAPADSGEH